jgi:hypothetical protein
MVMTAPKQQALLSPVITEPYQQRVDQKCQNVVNEAIEVQTSFNTICAFEYLKSHNVDPTVIERVLLRPEMRRKIQHLASGYSAPEA